MNINKKIIKEIADNIGNLEDVDKLKKSVSKALSNGIPIEELFEKGLKKGLNIVGEKYNEGEYFLADLMFSGTMVSEAMEILKPHLKNAKSKKKACMVIGTVAGDMHDIGKNLIKMLLTCRGWNVHDLGVDVSPKKFVEAIKKLNPDVLGMSSLLTTTTQMYGITIEELKKANLRSGLKVIIGGNAARKEIAEEIGADGYATSAQLGIDQCEMWIKK